MVGIAVPIHFRGGAGKNVIPNIKHLSVLPYDVVLCGSELNHSYRICKPFLNQTTHYVEVRQEGITTGSGGDARLRQKFNDSLHALTLYGVYEWYCLVGANDIVPAGFFESLDAKKSNRPTLAGQAPESPVYMMDTDNDRSCQLFLQYKTALLPGVNAMNKTCMERVDWKPYKYHGCEVGLEKWAIRDGWTLLQISGGHLVTLKSSVDLNTYNHIVRWHHTQPIKDKSVIDLYI